MKIQLLYRNNSPIGDIDEHCLWQLINNEFVLVDNDQHITLPYQDYNHLFYQVEN